MPFKMNFLPGFVFRQNKPAVVGAEIISGKIVNGVGVMGLDGKSIGTIKDIQDSGRRVEEAKKGERVAVSIEGGSVGKNLKEGDILISNLSERDYSKLKTHRDILDKEDKEIIKEVVKIKRTKNPLWGIN